MEQTARCKLYTFSTHGDMNSLKNQIRSNGFLIIISLTVFASMAAEIQAATFSCRFRSSPCFAKKMICPAECPSTAPSKQTSKVCYVNCNSPICRPECKNRKPNCNAPGAACLDPRFIGGDGVVFYFHGKSNEHFSLVSDPNLQINARFIGLRPASRTRDFTWIQALGFLFGTEGFSLEATKATTWDPQTDHLRFSYNGENVDIPQGILSSWESPTSNLRLERSSDRNSVILTIRSIAEISVNVVPVTKEDDRIHNYQIPTNNCFAHLEVQFRFYGLSSDVEGVLGRTYRPNFENNAKPGVAMPVVGGEDKYKTTSLLSADCKMCIFSVRGQSSDAVPMKYGTLDCTGRAATGNGIVCRR